MMAPSSALSDPTGHGSCSRREIPCDAGDQVRHRRGIPLRHFHHGRHVDIVVLGMPAIEIRHHGDGRIGDLGLASEFGLGHGRHAHHVVAEPR